jgi:uncharacterized protein YqhQ
MDQPEREEQQSLAFGGQALIEGIMIRSRKQMVICIRQTNKDILTHIEKIESISERFGILKIPFLRGIIALFETLYLGVKGIYFSANAALEQEEEELTRKEWAFIAILTVAISSMFFVVPFLLTSFLNISGIVFNIVEAIVRLALFLLYISLVSMWSEFKRILQYHGAEHKAINAYEAGEMLRVTNVKKYSRLHQRCGTSFIFIVIIVSILLFSIMPKVEFLMRLAYRLLLIPVIGAVSYELLRISGKHSNSVIIKILTAPGLVFQRLTTREPEDDMIEVAIRAVEEIIK